MAQKRYMQLGRKAGRSLARKVALALEAAGAPHVAQAGSIALSAIIDTTQWNNLEMYVDGVRVPVEYSDDGETWRETPARYMRPRADAWAWREYVATRKAHHGTP